jgi:hypothetical protein
LIRKPARSFACSTRGAMPWSDHFVYEGQHVLGITAVGRTTASLLEMNDPERRRVRELIANIQG